MRRIRQHVNPLKSDLLEIREVPRVEPPPGGRLEVELGSAEAYFLVDLARGDPEGRFVGIEIRHEVVTRANRRCRALGLANVESVFANMSVDLPRLFRPGTVQRFHLNFPDPWFKSRQHKRRVVAPALAEDIHDALAPGGELFVQTDIFDIALDAMAVLEGLGTGGGPRFESAHEPWSFLPANPFAARSRRERQCETEGVRIWRLIYRKVG